MALNLHRSSIALNYHLLARNTVISADQFESKRTLSMPDNEATEIAVPLVSAITNLFRWLTPSP